MKKLLLSFVVLSAVAVTAQVGINTDQPRGTLDAAYVNPQEAPAGTKWADPTTPQGLHFPNVSTAQRSKFEGMSEGMMIYNTDKKCLEVYLGVESGTPQWECIPNVGNKSSQSVSVSPAGFDGSFTGDPLVDASVSFKITNNGFSTISELDFSDAVRVGSERIRVDGSEYKSVSLKGRESKTLTYTLSGIPQAGQLTANFSKLGLSAEQQIMVGKGNASLQNQEQYIVSFAHDGTTIQGNIDNASNQISLKIPYTNGKGSYKAVKITRPTDEGQDGDINKITLSIPPGNFAMQGELTATLKVEGDGSYQVRQMAAGESYDIVTYDIDINGSRSKVIIKGIGGIPDKKFNEKTNGAYRHRFVYLPVTVTGADGYNKTWLNYNLGAEYAKVGANFKPQQQLFGRAAHDDDKTHGSLYQWQRASDGHEFMNQLPTDKKAPNWKNAGDSAEKFITSNDGNWVANGERARGLDLELWRSGKDNNPCPSGYHVPTIEEWKELLNAVGSNNKMWSQNKLPNLAAAGYRSYYNGLLIYNGSLGRYWSSSAGNSSRGAHYMYFSSDSSGTSANYYRGHGRGVRCIKDNN
ncbi:fibrobacter succinogenes major paralogous domain [Candidatus Ornithobacterium hominis]|uniref:Fibrobacter succinogenes major paralogous domain n=1 Tax=Candidatus Ornithobacterium hominis TaxID=2497989 RepID=A0A383TVG3_9FLAO|nr:FISUMP domain-containing protein [Candidatus Ornithobacterium hominis]MCT7903628.1 fibrobacter succinogenes major paralogous domain-containing protein [Candidatus Ornithobacterium hominis]SZD70966.1 fibrobacter succinogenes major paralogous domain [Candidatus Ornithobacterium hominis]